MTSTFGAATTSNPRPFKCTDCKIAFRIHGHLAKHLRSKMHIMKLECLGKLPFGTYAEMERSGINLNDIDTTDCDNSLTSLQVSTMLTIMLTIRRTSYTEIVKMIRLIQILAQRLCEKDPNKMGQWDTEVVPSQPISGGETSSDEGEPISQHPMYSFPVKVTTDAEMSRPYHVPIATEDPKSMVDVHHINSQFNQQKQEYGMKENANQSTVSPENSLQSYKCQVCPVSMRNVNELQVHCFVEHNIETESSTNIHGDRSANKCREKENTQKKIPAEERVVREDHNRQKIGDT